MHFLPIVTHLAFKLSKTFRCPMQSSMQLTFFVNFYLKQWLYHLKCSESRIFKWIGCLITTFSALRTIFWIRCTKNFRTMIKLGREIINIILKIKCEIYCCIFETELITTMFHSSAEQLSLVIPKCFHHYWNCLSFFVFERNSATFCFLMVIIFDFSFNIQKYFLNIYPYN